MINSSDILQGKILIVDDQEANVKLLERMLHGAGYTSIASTIDPLEVCELHRKDRYDLILLDLLMPGMDGFQVMKGLKEIDPDGYLPVLVITAQPDHKLRALQAGAKDFISKPFDLAEVLARVHNMLEVRLLHGETKNYSKALEQKVEERTRELRKNQAEKNRVTEQLIQAEKMAAIGTIASGIGHEINNPLQVIMGRAELILDEKDISACNEHARNIIKHTKNIVAIVNNLSGYSRPTSQHELVEIDVHEKLAEALAMAKFSLLDDRIKIRQNFAPVPKISAKPEEIQQIFFNVIRNGIQAMVGKKGILEITTTLEDNQVCIRIQDTGMGIQTEHLGKIFDPFFTTKGPDEGEGLGMYIVQMIVNKYNGTITLESQVDKGTKVTIRFPCVESI